MSSAEDVAEFAQFLSDTQAVKQANRVINGLAKEADEPLSPDIDPDRARDFTRPNYSRTARMRHDWLEEDGTSVRGLAELADGIIHREFPGVFLILNDIWAIAREPVVNESTGEIETDIFGWPVWKRLPSGAYIEDYSKLIDREKEGFMLSITMGLLEWRLKVDNWKRMPAMLARARWEEAMAEGFVAPTGRVTVEERTQRGRLHSADHRYFGIFQAELSRAAEHLVDGMELLGQRLKDSLAT